MCIRDSYKTDNPPVIDGKLDDSVWRFAPKITGFKTYQPDYGHIPSEKTEAYIAYDNQNLYFAVRCYDSEPDKIKASVTKRDNIFNEDNAIFILDTFGDNQSAYGFFLNPLGIQGDGIINSMGNGDMSIDLVWYSKGTIDKKGYTVEARIPFKSIRFPNKKEIEMGFAFARDINRKSEQVSYPEINPKGGSILSQLKKMVITDIKYERSIEFLPAFTLNQSSSINEGRLISDGRNNNISMTTKFGITSGLTLDATYNPDFSQVEADAGQIDVNLRYALYYPEKRPFFLEGKEYFEFAGNTEDAPLGSIVHTRNIIDPILGLKITGKISKKNRISSIIASDESPAKEKDSDGNLLHPGKKAMFSIFRHKYTLKDDGYIGTIYTGRDFNNGYNRVLGSDGRIRINPYNVFEYHLLKSYTRESDSNNITPGHALGIRYSYYSRRYIFDIGYQDISKNFHTDTGYITRKGIGRLAAMGIVAFYPKSSIFQKIDPFYWSYHIKDKFSGLFETFNLFCLRLWMPRQTMIRFEYIIANEVYKAQKFNTGGYGFRFNSQLNKKFFVFFMFRNGKRIFYDPDNPYQGKGKTISTSLSYQPSEKLRSSLSLTYSDFYKNSNSEKIYDYTIIRSRTTFQMNKYLFFRGILEYNTYRKKMTSDFLLSFTYIPGTVFHIGYGSIFEKIKWNGKSYTDSNDFLTTKKGLFFKVSYLWRM